MPQTTNVLLEVPTHGSEVGTWSTPMNADFASIDGFLGGATSISLTNVNVTLTKPTGTVTAAAGPTQSQNAVLKLTGTLTGNVVITLPLPGRYIVKNSCTIGAFYVQARALGTGNVVGLPDGRSVTIWNDGTDVDFADAPEVASALDLHCNTTTLPAWMTACTTVPYLIKNGATHTVSLYPALANRLGSTYGGNGATTFGVPDELNRLRLPVDGAGTTVVNRVTAAICGVNGTTFNSAGGDQRMQTHTHLQDSHLHAIEGVEGVSGPDNSSFNVWLSASDFGPGKGGNGGTTNATTAVNQSAGSGSSQNIPPVIVDFLPLIKT